MKEPETLLQLEAEEHSSTVAFESRARYHVHPYFHCCPPGSNFRGGPYASLCSTNTPHFPHLRSFLTFHSTGRCEWNFLHCLPCFSVYTLCMPQGSSYACERIRNHGQCCHTQQDVASERPDGDMKEIWEGFDGDMIMSIWGRLENVVWRGGIWGHGYDFYSLPW